MAEEIIEQQTQENDNSNYIEAINNLKATTVSKDKYDKLKEENAKLLNSLVKGETIAAAPETPKKTVNDIRTELFTKEHTDLEYVDLALQLRDATLEETGKDIFVSNSTTQPAKEEDYASAQKAADVFKQCIDSSNGDNALFLAHLQNRMLDVALPKKR